MQLREINIDQIKDPELLPRFELAAPGIQELAASIAENGLLQPIVVVKDGDKYRLVAGNRRLHACRDILGWDAIPSIVRDAAGSQDTATAVENLQRTDLNPVEEAVMFGTILNNQDMTQVELAKSIGKSRSYIAKRLMLLDLDDDTLAAVINNDISWTHALELRKLENLERRLYYLQLAVSHGVKVAILRDWISQEMQAERRQETPPEIDEQDIEYDQPAYEPMRCFFCDRSEQEVVLHFIPVCTADRRELAKELGKEQLK